MNRRGNLSRLNIFSVGMIMLSLILITSQLVSFSKSRGTYPEGMIIGDVPVENLSRQEAATRLLETFNKPIEILYADAIIHLDPGIIDFRLDLESMLAAADIERVGGLFWNDFFSFLIAEQSIPNPIPLDADFSEVQLINYLNKEIATRYDKPASISSPIPGTVSFSEGTPGTTIDINRAIFQIEKALFSPTERQVLLPIRETSPSRPSLYNLEVLLNQTMDLSGYDGIGGVYLLDLQTGEELHFVSQNGIDLPISPDVPFTTASIIKIPILVSIYKEIAEPYPEEAINLINLMIEDSGNDPADWLMEQFLHPTQGPIQVTNDLKELGLENTFLAGHFRLGSPLLARYTTPSNSRFDVDTGLDSYNQTTLSDIGSLLADIYQCAEHQGGALIAVFGDLITPSECQDMINVLSRNNTPLLVAAGIPEGTYIAHKHGWISDYSGAIRTIGDAAIVYTPNGNYVLVTYFYHPVQLIWDPVSTLIGNLSEAIYNYYTLPTP
jgi:beta-lactamase class A